MPSNKKPRKAYKPKYEQGTLPLTIRHSVGSDRDLKLVPHKELEKLRHGVADDYTINTLAFRLNWGYVMAGEVFDTPEAREITLRGLDAIRGVKARLARTGKYGASGEEFTQLGDALNITDDMQEKATRREQRETMKAVYLLNQAIKKEAA